MAQRASKNKNNLTIYCLLHIPVLHWGPWKPGSRQLLQTSSSFLPTWLTQVLQSEYRAQVRVADLGTLQVIRRWKTRQIIVTLPDSYTAKVLCISQLLTILSHSMLYVTSLPSPGQWQWYVPMGHCLAVTFLGQVSTNDRKTDVSFLYSVVLRIVIYFLNGSLFYI